MVYCDQCEAEADFQDSYCRICGRQSESPSITLVRRVHSSTCDRHASKTAEPAFVESPQTPEAPSLAPSPVAASDNAVTKDSRPRRARGPWQTTRGFRSCLSTPTEPFHPQMLQEVVVSSSTVATDSHKTFVLEKESITNRKGPVESGVESSRGR